MLTVLAFACSIVVRSWRCWKSPRNTAEKLTLSWDDKNRGLTSTHSPVAGASLPAVLLPPGMLRPLNTHKTFRESYEQLLSASHCPTSARSSVAGASLAVVLLPPGMLLSPPLPTVSALPAAADADDRMSHTHGSSAGAWCSSPCTHRRVRRAEAVLRGANRRTPNAKRTKAMRRVFQQYSQ